LAGNAGLVIGRQLGSQGITSTGKDPVGCLEPESKIPLFFEICSAAPIRFGGGVEVRDPECGLAWLLKRYALWPPWTENES
jgi:hypothetical protein